jgi:hypothetical protein
VGFDRLVLATATHHKQEKAFCPQDLFDFVLVDTAVPDRGGKSF